MRRPNSVPPVPSSSMRTPRPRCTGPRGCSPCRAKLLRWAGRCRSGAARRGRWRRRRGRPRPGTGSPRGPQSPRPRGLRRVRRGPARWSVAAAVGDPAELIHVCLDRLAGPGTLVAVDRPAGGRVEEDQEVRPERAGIGPMRAGPKARVGRSGRRVPPPARSATAGSTCGRGPGGAHCLLFRGLSYDAMRAPAAATPGPLVARRKAASRRRAFTRPRDAQPLRPSAGVRPGCAAARAAPSPRSPGGRLGCHVDGVTRRWPSSPDGGQPTRPRSDPWRGPVRRRGTGQARLVSDGRGRPWQGSRRRSPHGAGWSVRAG